MAPMLAVEVVYALPDRSWRVAVQLPAGATVADALALADLGAQVPGLDVDPARLAVFGRSATLQTTLHDGDRVEILRPLLADPKQARRERARSAGKP
ncbi:RnfH family protein [Arenimonas sp. MALMAid1274]|uniref:RnfH family protein n=1 Tax=Arenimonas sp. MALMAid1274 TaxID=3411630 RepID=UPI003BA00582